MADETRPNSKAHTLFVLVGVAVLVVLAVKFVWPPVSEFVANHVQRSVVDSAQTYDRAMAETAARDEFVPRVRQELPVLTDRVSDDKLVELAAEVCLSLSVGDEEAVTQEHVEGLVVGVLDGISATDTDIVLEAAVMTTCPLQEDWLQELED